MAFLCPIRLSKSKKGRNQNAFAYMPARITGSSSLESLLAIEISRSAANDDSKDFARMKMVILQDFQPCVEDELEVKRGDIVTLLYRDNDWVYVQASHGGEGFVPYSYCALKQSPNIEKPRKKQEMKSSFGRTFSYLKSIDRESQNRRIQPSVPANQLNFRLNLNLQKPSPDRSRPNVTKEESSEELDKGVVFRPQSPRQRFTHALNRASYNRMQQSDVGNNGIRLSNHTDDQFNHQPNSTLPSNSQPNTSATPHIYSQQSQSNFNNYPIATTGSGSSSNSKISNHSYQEYGESSDNLSIVGSAHQQQELRNKSYSLPDDGIVPDINNKNNNYYKNSNSNNGSPKSQGLILVTADFQAETDCDISIQQGELVKVLNIDNDNWAWIAKDNRKEGFVPLSSLSIDDETFKAISNQDDSSIKTDFENESMFSTDSTVIKQQGTRLVVLFDYQARTIDDLDVRRGEIVYAELDDQNDESWIWAYAPTSNKQGFIPRSFARPPVTSI
ncbi:SH3 and PX domain-containing protein 2B [Trichoplax sp. H2]|nr:SH3 and PX domain-containing protein 2B [Trichoplax sp. H2]|eukprot:RDD46879.1 SH3 and PX domain-containing protein 2B [Trichoplax sp. H2]